MANMLTKAQTKMLKLNYYAILNSRFLLYFIFFLSIIDLLFFSVAGEFGFIAVFILIGYLTSFFSKNMMVILTIAMVCTNIIRFGRDVRVEGMTMEEEYDEENHEGMTTEEEYDEENREGMTTGEEYDEEKGEESFMDSDFDKYLNSGTSKVPAPAPTRAPVKAPAPAKAPGPAKAPTRAPAPASIATSNFKPVDESNNLIASNSISNEDPSDKLSGLNAQTQSLLEKQQILLKNMDNLNPLLKKAESFMQQFQSMSP